MCRKTYTDPRINFSVNKAREGSPKKVWDIGALATHRNEIKIGEH
jgi:hypothetical protein